jgi:hypothetical protein
MHRSGWHITDNTRDQLLMTRSNTLVANDQTYSNATLTSDLNVNLPTWF